MRTLRRKVKVLGDDLVFRNGDLAVCISGLQEVLGFPVKFGKEDYWLRSALTRDAVSERAIAMVMAFRIDGGNMFVRVMGSVDDHEHRTFMHNYVYSGLSRVLENAGIELGIRFYLWLEKV